MRALSFCAVRVSVLLRAVTKTSDFHQNDRQIYLIDSSDFELSNRNRLLRLL